MIAVGNNELGKELGKTAKCPVCSRELDVQSTGPLNTVKCSCGEGEVYLIGMNGREINQSTPDHTEDKLDKVDIREYNNRLHGLAIKILFGSASSNRHGDFDPTSDEVKRAYELADTILTIGTTYEWNEYNGIESLRSNQAEEKEKPEGKWKLNHSNMLYWIENDNGNRVDLKYLAWRNDYKAQEAAQKIADIYNEVMP